MNRSAPAAVRTGKASSTSSDVTTMSQVNTGMRKAFMVGMRRQNTVVRMLTAVRIPEKPVRTRLASHRSPPRPGERTGSDSGVYPNQPKAAAPPAVAKPEIMVMPPPR